MRIIINRHGDKNCTVKNPNIGVDKEPAMNYDVQSNNQVINANLYSK